ncbi:MAG TPA: selenium-dependent molybdenum cofactor biosynthesis protein YqeB [Candidatus Wallbacteria bacterium]|nr:selenium-dependent molybdenum cofactor biosynthesis protein YqeB [Candidatus Wallbacteria bacterium]
MFHKIKCVIKGGGDLASGVAYSLFRAGFTVVILEIPEPTAVRRTVAFSTAVTDGFIDIEGVTGRKSEANELITKIGFEPLNYIPVIVDPEALCLGRIKPHIFIDAIVNKKNYGTKITDAPLVIALGPGFTAGTDCHAVIETNRGHNLGRILTSGCAEVNTGKPGSIMGHTFDRVLRNKKDGVFKTTHKIGDYVKKGDIVGYVNNYAFRARIDGVIRGLLPDNFKVKFYTKIGDIDPRNDNAFCFSISDKSRSIGRAALEAVLIKIKEGVIKP